MSIVLQSSGGGLITIQEPTTASNFTQTLPAGTGTTVVNGVNSAIVSDTAKTATGTSVDFTGIPSWVKRVTVMFSGVSTSGTSNVQIQLGDSGGVETTGYLGASPYWATAIACSNLSSGFTLFDAAFSAASVRYGSFVLTNFSGNTWICNGAMGRSDNVVAVGIFGQKALSDVLDRIRITTVNGTDTFDAGSINLQYEG